METSRKVGIIGLGIMGHAMALNAKKAGFDVTVTNRSLDKASDLTAHGISVVSTPKELAEKVEIIVTMVTDPAAVLAVTSGPGGFLKSDVKGKIFIQTSTIDAKTTQALAVLAADNGMEFLDSPVTGSKKQVEEAQLILLVGGAEAVLKKAEPFLLSVGKTIVHAGEIGQGTALKLCMNLIVAQMTTALCESVALAQIQGLDPKKIFEVLTHSPALSCGYFKIKEQPILNKNFAPAFSLANMLKDVRFIDQVAKEAKLPLPVTQAVRFLMEGALNEGLGGDDLTVISKLLWPKHLSQSGV